MADRQKFCVGIMSLIIILSACYLGYYLFLNTDRVFIDQYNHIRFYVFFGQHFLVIAMLFGLLGNPEEHDYIVKWMFQLSAAVVMSFFGGEVFVLARGGRILGAKMGNFINVSQAHEAIIEFELNQITLYFQIMTDFALFFIVSAIAMIILRCRDIDTEERYEFMIENLKSEEFVDEPDADEKKGCAICLTDLEAQRVLKLPCDHIFHKECLMNWLKRSTICPMCRNDIEQSLSPTSSHRYPPIHSEPVLLPPPPSSVQNPPPSNSIIQPRQVISLSNQNRGRVVPNQNLRTGNRLDIFERFRVNEERGNYRLRGREIMSPPVVGEGLELEVARENESQQIGGIRALRSGWNRDSKRSNSGVVTQRINQTTIKVRQNQTWSTSYPGIRWTGPSPANQAPSQGQVCITFPISNGRYSTIKETLYPNLNEQHERDHKNLTSLEVNRAFATGDQE